MSSFFYTFNYNFISSRSINFHEHEKDYLTFHVWHTCIKEPLGMVYVQKKLKILKISFFILHSSYCLRKWNLWKISFFIIHIYVCVHKWNLNEMKYDKQQLRRQQQLGQWSLKMAFCHTLVLILIVVQAQHCYVFYHSQRLAIGPLINYYGCPNCKTYS